MHSRLAAAWTVGLAALRRTRHRNDRHGTTGARGSGPTCTGRARTWRGLLDRHARSGPLGSGGGSRPHTRLGRHQGARSSLGHRVPPRWRHARHRAAGTLARHSQRRARSDTDRSAAGDARTGLGGLLDVSLHPRFAQNRLIYMTYSKPGPGAGNATTAVMRARWDGGSTLTDVKDILVADAYHGGPGSPQGPRSCQRQLRLAARVGQSRIPLRLARRSQLPAGGAGPGVAHREDSSPPR